MRLINHSSHQSFKLKPITANLYVFVCFNFNSLVDITKEKKKKQKAKQNKSKQLFDYKYLYRFPKLSQPIAGLDCMIHVKVMISSCVFSIRLPRASAFVNRIETILKWNKLLGQLNFKLRCWSKMFTIYSLHVAQKSMCGIFKSPPWYHNHLHNYIVNFCFKHQIIWCVCVYVHIQLHMYLLVRHILYVDYVSARSCVVSIYEIENTKMSKFSRLDRATHCMLCDGV